jgi:murein DD-endopeptidase MepM/ murein hydrolase activator NlpD
VKHPALIALAVLAALVLTRGKGRGAPSRGRGQGQGGQGTPARPGAADVAPSEPGSLGVVVYPVRGGAKVVSPFGASRGNDRTHLGVDLGAPEGTELLAMTDGAVHYAADAMGGHVALLKRADGSVIYYAHMSEPGTIDRIVKAGDVIGHVGMSGNAAHTTPHVHLELWPDGDHTHAIDPTDMLTASRVSGASGRRVRFDVGQER